VGEERGEPVRYVALNSGQPAPRHWWDRVPGPVVSVALCSWGLLPGVVRQQLARLTPLINPQATTSAESGPRPDAVPGVLVARGQGFTPIEELTGSTEVVSVWPPQHRRRVRETRAGWPTDDSDGWLWLVRSPWRAVTVEDALSLVWSNAETKSGLDLHLASDVLRWSHARAKATLATRPPGYPDGR
jgi:hypothetical protein